MDKNIFIFGFLFLLAFSLGFLGTSYFIEDNAVNCEKVFLKSPNVYGNSMEERIINFEQDKNFKGYLLKDYVGCKK